VRAGLTDKLAALFGEKTEGEITSPAKSGNILKTSVPKMVRSATVRVPNLLIGLAPRVGLEPTTNGLTGEGESEPGLPKPGESEG
jgi:hypothetical protein